MRKLLLAGVAIAALCGVAASQVNFVPQPGITSGYLAKTTYSSAFFGLVPPASATDEICIAGSASKVIRVGRIMISGTAGTLVTLPITVVRRAVADTGGTAATTTANPGVTTQIASRDTGQSPNSGATATLISYTAVPTINDAAPVYVDSALLTLNLTSASGGGITTFDWSRDVENNIQIPTLRGVAQQLCVNFNAVSISTGSVTGSIVWSEE
jgi:hypothetical protein